MSLKLILGCMYSGKTTEILRIVNSLKHINEKPIIIKPKLIIDIVIIKYVLITNKNMNVKL